MGAVGDTRQHTCQIPNFSRYKMDDISFLLKRALDSQHLASKNNATIGIE